MRIYPVAAHYAVPLLKQEHRYILIRYGDADTVLFDGNRRLAVQVGGASLGGGQLDDAGAIFRSVIEDRQRTALFAWNQPRPDLV